MTLLSFGSNGNHQLGLGHADDVYVPTECKFTEKLEEKEPPKQVACGGNHTILLFPSGNVYVSGRNRSGQCALPPCEAIEVFTKIPPPPETNEKWDYVAAGWESTILVSTSGRFYPFGKGDRGELGLGEGITIAAASSDTPGSLEGAKYIEDFPPHQDDLIQSISSSITHTVVCLSSGRVYGWGAGRKGQLGKPAKASVWSPREIHHSLDSPFGVCGRDFTFLVDERTLNGRVLGKNRWDIDTMPFDFFASVTNKVHASWNGIYIHTVNDDVMAWGRNDRSQIPPMSFGHICKLAVGSEHGLCVTKDTGKLLAWGWNEHGNCGVLGADGKPVDVVPEPTEISVPQMEDGSKRIRFIAGGCATSWLWIEEVTRD